MADTGYIHSFQSMGAVDGPGLRFVVFTQGCPHGCAGCHNPETHDPNGGTERTAAVIIPFPMRLLMKMPWHRR